MSELIGDISYLDAAGLKAQLEHAFVLIRELSKGKILQVGRHTLAMGEDLSIGYITTRVNDGKQFVVTDLTLREIIDLMILYNCVPFVPPNKE